MKSSVMMKIVKIIPIQIFFFVAALWKKGSILVAHNCLWLDAQRGATSLAKKYRLVHRTPS